MKVLVAGSNGFVGINLTRYLLEQGHEVVMTYRGELTEQNRKVLSPYQEKIAAEKGDLLSPELYDRLEKHDIDAIVNSAIMTSGSNGETEDFVPMCNINLRSNLMLMEFAVKKKVKKYIYVSSSGVYGSITEPEIEVMEDSQLDLFNTYCITKYSSELLVARMGKLFGIDAASARIAAPYGDYERVTGGRVEMSVIYKMAHMALSGEEAVICERDSVRDWTYVKDTVKGIYALLTAEHLKYPVYNVACGQNRSLEDIAGAVRKVCPEFKYRFTDKAEEANVVMLRSGQRGYLSIRRLCEETGFKPEYSLEEGIASYINSLREES